MTIDQYYYYASLVGTLITGVFIGYLIAKNHFYKELTARQSQERTNQQWVDYLSTLQGGRHE